MNQQPSAPANPIKPGPQHLPVEPDRHARKCLVCAHPKRDAIDHGFLHWRNPLNLAREFDIPLPSIYRHAHSTGLFAHRTAEIRHSLEFKQAERTMPSADIHANERRQQVIVTTRDEHVAAPTPEPPPPTPPADEYLVVNEKPRNTGHGEKTGHTAKT